MKRQKNKLVAGLFWALFCATAFALPNEVQWQGPDGGKWSEGKNWTGGEVPTAEDSVAFKGGKVVLDKDVSAYRITFLRGNSADPHETVIVGNGHTINTVSTGSYSYVWEYHSTTLDGVTVTSAANGRFNVHGSLDLINDASLDFTEVNAHHDLVKFASLPGGSIVFRGGEHHITVLRAYASGTRVVINGGSFPLVSGSWFYSVAGAEFELNGGHLTAPVDVTGKFTMTGGVWEPRCAPWVRDGSDVAITGGTVKHSFKQGLEVNGWVGASLVNAMTEDAVLESYGNLSLVSNSELRVTGTIIASNNTFYAYAESEVAGGGAVYADEIRVYDYNGYDVPSELVFEDDPALYVASGFHMGMNRTVLAFPDGVDIGSMGDWVLPTGSPGAKTYFSGAFDIDTSDVHGGDPHSVSCSNLCARYGASVSVTGGGSATLHFADEGRLDALSVAAGNTVTLNSFARTGTLTLGDGAKLKLTAGTSALEIGTCTFGEGAAVEVSLPASPTDVYPVLVPASASGDLSGYLSKVSLTGDGASAAELKCLNGCIVVMCSESKTHSDAYTCLWTGAAGDGSWNTSGNWRNSTIPDKWKEPYFSGKYPTADVNSWKHSTVSVMLNGIHFLHGISPFGFTISAGHVLEIASRKKDALGCGISSASDSPVVFGCDVRPHNNTGNPFYMIALPSVGRSYMQFNGSVKRQQNSDQEFILRPMGDVRFAGEVICSNLTFAATSGSQRYSAVTVLDGAEMEVRTQCSNLVEKGVFRVAEGGSLSIAGSRYRWTTENDWPHEIDGTMTVTAPISSVGCQTYAGDGSLSVGAVKSDPEGEGELEISGTLEFTQSTDWTTVTAEAPGSPITLSASGTPTIRAIADWTYGPGVGESASEPVDRSLFVAEDATLSVDAGSHTVTFEDPVQGEGSLKVSGGEVKFLSPLNSLEGCLDVDSGTALIEGGFDSSTPLTVGAGGTAVLFGEQEFASVDGSGILSFRTVDGTVSSLSVSGTADLSGLALKFDSGTATALKEGRIDLVSAEEIVGAENFASDLRYEVVTENGKQILRVRAKAGTVVVLR